MHRCFASNIGLHTAVNGQPLALVDVCARANSVVLHPDNDPVALLSSPDKVVPGTAVPVFGGRELWVKCADGFVAVRKVQFPTRRPITVKQLYHQLQTPKTSLLRFQ